ncbi:MAG: flagellar hook-associated protein 3 [Spirochaetes bacterium GWC1_27_15]|nr:MAG: flagellar hook-associated protein 3 [Spirochaetes bacterium GWB1_27_13]OHD25866.1 MAG: flagellar hook-associated protein 3 [Spirochaetes bacterium GWC1_27_15]
MYRISSNMPNDSGVFHLKNREYSMDKVNEQINTGKKHRLPREDVIDVTQALTFHTKIHKIDQYNRNIDDAQSERSLVESKLTNTVEILQRVRELAVQGANGSYTEEDRKNMAMEVDQLLRNVILDGNSKFKGDFLFSGFQKYTEPFEVLEGAVRGINESMIKEVRYLGDNGKHLREVDGGEYIATSMPGSEMYWAEQFQIYSSVNTKDFRLTKDQSIMIDKNKIDFKAGDNVYAIVDKINQSAVAVNASLDMVTGGLIIKSTKPHKIELGDIEGGTVLQDLGIIEEGRPYEPDNYSQTATVFGGSVFDALIGLRDSFLQNNQEDVGGRFLGAIDGAIDNITFHLSESGAMSNRLTYLQDRLGADKEAYTESLTKVEDVDITDAITELKQLEFAQKASLSSLSRLTRTSLMDFLR